MSKDDVDVDVNVVFSMYERIKITLKLIVNINVKNVVSTLILTINFDVVLILSSMEKRR